MNKMLGAFFLGTVMATTIGITPSFAQYRENYYRDNYNDQTGFEYFYNGLAPYGRWVHSPRWGDVWRPYAGRDFRPYYYGHWELTREFGWYWDSNEPFGYITYHYGRWVYDDYYSWLWVPGYVWGPAWVVWRSGYDVTGWAPMPPDENFLDGYDDGYNDWSDSDYYGYRRWYDSNATNIFVRLFIFIGNDHFADRDCYRYARPTRDYNFYFHQTTNVTNYVMINNYVVNRSIDPRSIEQASRRRIAELPARTVMEPLARITPLDVGRKLQLNDRRANPIGFIKGTGGTDARDNGRQFRDFAGGRGNALEVLSHRVVFPQAPNAPAVSEHVAPPSAPDQNWRRRLGNFQNGQSGPNAIGGAPINPSNDNRDWRRLDRGAPPASEFTPLSGGSGPVSPPKDNRDWRRLDRGTPPVNEFTPPPGGSGPVSPPKDNRDWRRLDRGTPPVNEFTPPPGGSSPVSPPNGNRDWHRMDRGTPPVNKFTPPPDGSSPVSPPKDNRDQRRQDRTTLPP